MTWSSLVATSIVYTLTTSVEIEEIYCPCWSVSVKSHATSEAVLSSLESSSSASTSRFRASCRFFFPGLDPLPVFSVWTLLLNRKRRLGVYRHTTDHILAKVPDPDVLRQS